MTERPVKAQIDLVEASETPRTVFRVYGTDTVRRIVLDVELVHAEMNPEQTVCVDMRLENVTTGTNVKGGVTSCLLPQQVPGEIFPQIILLHFFDGVLALAPDPYTDDARIVNEFSLGAYKDATGSAVFSGTFLDLDYLDDPAVVAVPELPSIGVSVTLDYFIIINLDSTDDNDFVDCIEELIGRSCPFLDAESSCPDRF